MPEPENINDNHKIYTLSKQPNGSLQINYDIAVKMTTLMNYESRRVICTFPREIIISWSHTSPFSEAMPISLVSLKLILDIIFSS